MTNFLIALSFGTQRAQFVQRTGLTCPRLCLQRPPLRRFFVYKNGKNYERNNWLEIFQSCYVTNVWIIRARPDSAWTKPIWRELRLCSCGWFVRTKLASLSCSTWIHCNSYIFSGTNRHEKWFIEWWISCKSEHKTMWEHPIDEASKIGSPHVHHLLTQYFIHFIFLCAYENMFQSEKKNCLANSDVKWQKSTQFLMQNAQKVNKSTKTNVYCE